MVPEVPVPVTPLAQLQAVLATCETKRFEGPARRSHHPPPGRHRDPSRRLLGLNLEDVDLDDRSLEVLGKGGRRRVVPFGTKTAKALDRYDVA